MNTTENNKLIAEFMKWKTPSVTIFEDGEKFNVFPNGFEYNDNLLYHSDWNWLMEVVEKIEDLNFSVEINKQEDGDYQCLVSKSEILFSSFCATRKEAVYNCFIDFIKWYNQQEK